jgi:hypothetical protein
LTLDDRGGAPRRDGCKPNLHFTNAGAALMPAPVLQAQLGQLQLEA